MPYTPHTPTQIQEMLNTIKVDSQAELFNTIAPNLRAQSFDLPQGLDEFSLYNDFKRLSKRNEVDKVSFMGGGYYDHIVPSAVDALASRSEFYTAYTPYQAEASQGTLQSLYEYQSHICAITGMEVSNASMYDGATALAEAALMAVRITKRTTIIIDEGVNLIYRKIVATYLSFRGIKLITLLNDQDSTKADDIKLNENIAAYIFQNPNFFGSIQDYSSLISQVHKAGALIIASVYPVSLGMLQDPGSMDVDIVSGDGQSLGNYLNFGGPSFGFLATKKSYIRELPGRIIGKTQDQNNKVAFVLTMQAREQHIRRHRATSNICSNQSLLALRATIFLSLLGKDGLGELAQLNYQNANYLKKKISAISKVKLYNKNPIFNEFVIQTPLSSKDLLKKIAYKGIFGGICLANLLKDHKNSILISVTEQRTKQEMDTFVEAIKEALCL